MAPIAGAGQQTDSGGTPKRRRGVQTAHIDAFLPNHPGAEKANAGHDLRGDTRRTCIGELTFKDDENRGTKRNQRIGPQSRQTLPPLNAGSNIGGIGYSPSPAFASRLIIETHFKDRDPVH